MKNNYDIVLIAVNNVGKTLQYANETMKNNYIVLKYYNFFI